MSDAEDFYTSVGGLKLPRMATKPAVIFMPEHMRAWKFLIFVTQSAIFTSSRRGALLEEIDKEAKMSTLTAYFKSVYQGLFEDLYSLEYHEELMWELVLCRMADNYLTYLTQLLSLVFESRPETLKSGEQERLDFILQHTTMEELVHSLAEKRVERLAYLGMHELAQYLDTKLGLRLFERGEDEEAAVRVVELRNLIVHNHGIVNKRFKKRVPHFSLDRGSRIRLDARQAQGDAIFLANSVYDIDRRAAAKFALPQLPLGTPFLAGLAKNSHPSTQSG